eukprot:TRINITY_DN6540_c0_g1_i1.p2 TRINITY_DN6540_c0_g1~~TRINITY_DN6540_c0_g1_i1.p2  ORF type:complete len:98 (+),score=11.89 TRINITY_DN6540_c0_g1_i1:194-487(+)
MCNFINRQMTLFLSGKSDAFYTTLVLSLEYLTVESVLVVGGTGGLGKWLIPLFARHLQVKILTRNPEKLQEEFGSSIECIKGDLENEEQVCIVYAFV